MSGIYSNSNRHRMHEKMDKPSDTPRTDEQELAYEAEDGSTYVHTTFARKLERENNELRRALKLAFYGNEDMAVLIQELLKDRERLDWLLNEAGMAHLCWAANGREQIDKAMEEAQ